MLIRDCAIRDYVHSGWCPFGMVSIRDGVHSGWCPFGMVSIRDGVHSGWCPFGMVSIRDGVWCPFGIVSIQNCVFRDRVQDLGVSIQNRLKNDLGLPSRCAAIKPLLTEKMRQKRLTFTKKYWHWT